LRKWANVITGRGFVLSVLAVGFLLNGCGGAITHEVCATVLATEGSVEIDGQRASLPDSVKTRLDLCAGTIVRTSSGAQVQIACLPNALVHLSENSALKIESVTLRKDGNETDDEMEARAVRCRLMTGAMDLSHRGTEGVAELIASTPHGKLIAKFNCVVRVAVDEKKTRITCASGMVTFVPANGDAGVTVEGGFVTEWPSSTPMVAAPAENTSDQQALVDAFERAQRLEALLKARGASFPWKSP